jgi:hypothetical protein
MPATDRDCSSPRYCQGDLRASIGDAAAYSVMVGLGETYLPAFALAAGLGEIAAGLVTTVPMLMGATLQLLAPWGLRLLGSYRRWVVTCATLQALAFVPLVIGALTRQVPQWLVFGAATCYWAADKSTGGPWNTWIGQLVPQRVRPAYFARRSRIAQACVLGGFLSAGCALQSGAAWGDVLDVFALLFLAAGMARFVSSRFLAAQRDVASPASFERTVPLAELLQRLRGSADGTLLLYFLAVQCAVQISGPYFNPYMLQHLHLSYLEYVVLIGASLAARVVSLPALGNIARRWGARRLLWIGGVGIAPMSAAWLLTDWYPMLVVLQLAVGVVWAAYELAMCLLFLEALRPEERTSVLTRYNFAHAFATATGSLAGSAALTMFGKTPTIYYALFAASSLARVAALFVLSRVPVAKTSDSREEPELIELPTVASRTDKISNALDEKLAQAA